MQRFLWTIGSLSLVIIVITNINYNAARVEQMLSAASESWQSVTLPFHVARLSARDPDTALVMPVEGVRVRQVADTWGAPRSGGRKHEGQDIFAERGTPIFSATDGYVLSVGEGGLGGKKIFVLGAGGRRYYYAHLDAFAEELRAGDRVTPQTLLGYVGNTGNAATTPPHLHFGVYGSGGALDPLPLIVEREVLSEN